jgi:hypothetical protein
MKARVMSTAHAVNCFVVIGWSFMMWRAWWWRLSDIR